MAIFTTLALWVTLTQIGWAIYYYFFQKTKKGTGLTGTQLKNEMAKSRERIKQNSLDETATNKKNNINISKKALLQGGKVGSKKRWAQPNSALYLKAIKNLPGDIEHFDISKNGKALAVSTKSRTIYIFFLNKILSKYEPNETHEYVSFQVESHPKKLSISEKANLIVIAFNTKTEIYERKGKIYKLKSEISGEHLSEILELFVNEEHKYVQTVGNQSEKFIVAWDLNGNKLAKTNTSLTDHRNCSIDKEFNRLTIGTWSSDVSIFGCIFDPHTSAFKGLKKILSATGHKSGILGSCFSDNCKEQISVSKDGTVKEWSLDVRWESGETPKLLNSYSHNLSVNRDESQGLNQKFFSLEGRKFFLLLGSDIEILELEDDKINYISKIESAHNGEWIGKGSIIINSEFKKEKDEVYLITYSNSKVLIWDLCKLNI